MSYPARTGYLDEQKVAEYERVRFSGLMGRYRYAREQAGVGAMVGRLPRDLEFLDVPCGNGRWWSLLEAHATRITAIDVSPAMLRAAESRIARTGVEVTVAEGDAEALPLEDGAVDVAFSHALTKHLPVPVQGKVLAELARVSRRWVVCSFSIFGPVTHQIWRRREFLDSHPLRPEQLDELASAAGLRVVAKKRCSTPIGVEHSVLLERSDPV